MGCRFNQLSLLLHYYLPGKVLWLFGWVACLHSFLKKSDYPVKNVQRYGFITVIIIRACSFIFEALYVTVQKRPKGKDIVFLVFNFTENAGVAIPSSRAVATDRYDAALMNNSRNVPQMDRTEHVLGRIGQISFTSYSRSVLGLLLLVSSLTILRFALGQLKLLRPFCGTNLDPAF